jgi:hypothetical protein
MMKIKLSGHIKYLVPLRAPRAKRRSTLGIDRGKNIEMINFPPTFRDGLLSIGLFLFLLIPLYGNTGDNVGLHNYTAIRTAHIKWEAGLWGSKSYYEKQLRQLLIDMIEKDITTDFDYIPDLGRISAQKVFIPDTYSGKWLQVHGPLEQESLKNILGRGRDYIRDIEKNKYLFALSGRIKRFRLEDSQRGRILHLQLHRVTLIPHENKVEN